MDCHSVLTVRGRRWTASVANVGMLIGMFRFYWTGVEEGREIVKLTVSTVRDWHRTIRAGESASSTRFPD